MHIREVMRLPLKIALTLCLAAAPRMPALAEPMAPLFSDTAPLDVKIEAPLTTLMEARPEEEYLDGTFSFADDDGQAHSLELKLRTRGNFRRQPVVCNFAPIRLNFKKKQVKGTLFDGQDKLKLVTHCKNGVSYYQQLVLREYLAYRMLQQLTDKSFGVRLLQIDYVDTETGESMNRIGFVIEDNGDVADRLGMQAVKRGNIEHADLDPAHESLINLFQYMIGNTDYSLVKGQDEGDCCHNSELLSATGEAPFFPLPYDFDFAGMVNAPYAQPAPEFELLSVRQRLYRGTCSNTDILAGTIQRLLEHRADIYRTIDDTTLLSGRSRKDVTNYLDAFFKTISNPKTIESRLIKRCN
jgi:hypothetical protein